MQIVGLFLPSFAAFASLAAQKASSSRFCHRLLSPIWFPCVLQKQLAGTWALTAAGLTRWHPVLAPWPA